MTDEQRKRIHDIEYSCDSRAELAERIVGLEDERNHWHVEQAHAYSNWEDACKRAKELESENAKLRKFVQAVTEDVFGGELFDCGGCRFFRGCYNGEEREHEGRGCQWWLWAHELGIEVDV